MSFDETGCCAQSATFCVNGRITQLNFYSLIPMLTGEIPSSLLDFTSARTSSMEQSPRLLVLSLEYLFILIALLYPLQLLILLFWNLISTTTFLLGQSLICLRLNATFLEILLFALYRESQIVVPWVLQAALKKLNLLQTG
jgi:hypothetical protein